MPVAKFEPVLIINTGKHIRVAWLGQQLTHLRAAEAVVHMHDKTGNLKLSVLK